eukprot:Phypoly_transcript_02763.p1 GENE.Phypoly_transcript_02763~~Phypoly_transcript_02763.p1  ORF type:complete len:851 (-),score=113.42 Phypoly_transcript_02763:138-2615(-)
MEAIDVRFCAKCGAVTNSSSAVDCAFCLAPLKKLAKISQHARQPSATNKRVDYLAVLKTFNPVNRESKYTEQVERGRIAGLSLPEGRTSVSALSAELNKFNQTRGNALPFLQRSKQRVYFPPYSGRTFNLSNNIPPNTPHEDKAANTHIHLNSQTLAGSLEMGSGMDDQDRPKVIVRARSSLAMSNSDLSVRALVRTSSSREMSSRNLATNSEGSDVDNAADLPTPTAFPIPIPTPPSSPPFVMEDDHNAAENAILEGERIGDATDYLTPLQQRHIIASSEPSSTTNSSWGSYMPVSVVGGSTSINNNNNGPPPMASHRHDSSKLLARSDPQPRTNDPITPFLCNAQSQQAFESRGIDPLPESRRSKLAKTGNFYIKSSLKPEAPGVFIGLWLENILSNLNHSPLSSPTDVTRPKTIDFDANDPSLDTQPRHCTTTTGEKEPDSLSPLDVPLSGTPPPGSPQSEGIEPSTRHPYLSAAAPRWCKVVNELFSTEHEYLKDLELLVAAQESMNARPDLEAFRDSISIIFANVEPLLASTNRLYTALTQPFLEANSLESQELPDMCVNHICDTFIGMSEGFTVYIDYCINYNKSTSLARKLSETNPNFRDQLQKIEQSTYRNTPLASFLVKPVQRVFRYPMLFKELAKCLPSESHLAMNLQKAINNVEAVLTTINEAKRSEDQLKAMQRVKGELLKLGLVDFEVCVPYRLFIKDGFIDAVDATSLRPPKTFKNSKTWRYFLFNDIFICVRKSIRKTSKLLIPLVESIVLDLPENAFQMIHIRYKIWIFVASSFHEKKILLEALENGIRKSASSKVLDTSSSKANSEEP